MQAKREKLFTYRALSDKEKKNLLIFDLLRKNKTMSRTDISKATDINIVSISNYIKSYIEKGYIEEKGVDVSSGGRRPELVELRAQENYIVGIEVGAACIRVVVADLAVKVIAKETGPRPKGADKEVAAAAAALARTAIEKSRVDKTKIKMIGVGTSDSALLEVAGEIDREMGIETYAASDAACAAFAEKRLNPLADVDDLLYMHSDIGCGIVIKGDIYFGSGGEAGGMMIAASENGKAYEHVFAKESQYLRSWGHDMGIICFARKEIERGIGTKMVALAKGDLNNLTKDVVIEAARQNDEVAFDIIKGAAMNLGVRIAYLVNLFNPEAVVVGGGIEKAGDMVLEPIVKVVKKLAQSGPANIVKIIPSSLGDDVVSLGAVSLAIREMFLRA